MNVVPGNTATPESYRKYAFWLGAALALLLLLGVFIDADRFFQSYLFAYVFWIELTLGCLAMWMVHNLTGGEWGRMVRPFLEAGALTLPVMGLLFLPIFFGLESLYPWAKPELVQSNPHLEHKTVYLNIPFFAIRTLFYFAAWSALAIFLDKWTHRYDGKSGEIKKGQNIANLSAGGLVLYGFTVIFASFDWTMSLDPLWFSTMYGFLFVAQQAPAVMGLVILCMAVMASRSAWKPGLRPITDLGNLLLAFLLVWAYISFFQFFLIWMGNLPEEVTWYLERSNGGWGWVVLFLFFFHFCVPFLVLFLRRVKSDPRILGTLAGIFLFVHLVSVFWLVIPSFQTGGFSLHWLDVAAPIGIGSIWLWFFLGRLGNRDFAAVRQGAANRG